MTKPKFSLFSSLRYDPQLISLEVNEPKGKDEYSHDVKVKHPFYMVSYHQDRILEAAEHFGWTTAADQLHGRVGLIKLLGPLSDAVCWEGEKEEIKEKKPMRLRVLLDHTGKITVETNPAPEVSKYALYPHRLPPPRSSQPEIKVSPLTGGALMVGPDDLIEGDPPLSGHWDIIPDTARTIPSPFTSFKTTSRDMYTSARERVGITDMAEKKEVLLISEKGEIMEGSLTSVFFWRNGKWVSPSVESGGQIGTTRRWALKMGVCVEGVIRVESLVEGEECWISNGVRGFQIGRVRLAKGS